MTEKRDLYLEKLKARIDEWNKEIRTLEARAAQADAEAEIEYKNKLKELRAKLKDMEHRMAALNQDGAESWDDLKQGLQNSWDILKKGLNRAKSDFKRGYREGREE